MTKTKEIARLKEALEEAGSGWIFDFWGGDLDKNLDMVRRDIEDFAREYERRFGDRPDPYNLVQENASKAAAFFQIDTLMASVEMKIMIWRVLLGCEIASVEFGYEAGAKPSLVIQLRPPYGGKLEKYTGQPSDFRVLRHFGVTHVNGELFLQGYYAARGTTGRG